MTIDPISLLEKLINEHASAAVLRDHLAFFRDRFSSVSQENDALKKENAGLKDLNVRLQTELRAKASVEPEELSERAFTILSWIHDEDGKVTMEQIVEKLKIGKPEAKMHLTQLYSRCFIGDIDTDHLDAPDGYTINTDGTAYVLKRRGLT